MVREANWVQFISVQEGDQERNEGKETLTRTNSKSGKGARSNKSADKAEGERAVLMAIAAMPEQDRVLGMRLHAVIKAASPALSPKLWYTMPAYAKDGKVICFFRESHTRPATGRAPSVGARRYFTFGFNETANLDEGAMWPIAFALTEVTPAEEARITTPVKKAVS